MKFKYLVIYGLLAITAVSCKKEAVENPSEIMSVNDINSQLYREVEKQGVYNWSTASDELLWSAAMQSDSIFAIGYQPASFADINSQMHTINIESSEWIQVRDEILDIILKEEQKLNPNKTMDDLLPYGYPTVVPSMSVYLTSFEAVQKLRAMSTIRYFEPMGYELPPLNANANDRSDSGCGASPDYGLNPLDYETILPGIKQSWHHGPSNISTAWTSTTGDNVTIAIIDTGISDDQDNLNGNFNSGYSSGRTVEQISTHYTGRWWWRSLEAPHDQCGHGTQMAGLAAAPRSTDGNAVGIAYNCDLIGFRAVNDVFISSSNEKNGVKDALIIAGTRTDVKVISMSIGTPFYSGTVADGIYYAYGNGKSIFSAAGTSFAWTAGFGVIFPASMSQTIAVTGVKEGETESCDVCHDGSAVDFTMIMERSADADRHGLTVATYADQPTYVGGSSCATASVAGIAALVYSNNPGITRDAVYNRLKENASNYPTADGDHGWGVIDANAAVSD
ncbi:MAG: S8 family serine peptidase [Crocinitomix sp.]|nr:S8 family serine peptidase [Crocinitomix sp.]